jgi:hypothetical protein
MKKVQLVWEEIKNFIPCLWSEALAKSDNHFKNQVAQVIEKILTIINKLMINNVFVLLTNKYMKMS